MDFFNKYACEVTEIKNPEHVEVTEVLGEHLNGKPNSDVEAFFLMEKSLRFFPKKLDTFFPNIMIMKVSGNQITSISPEDLAPWSNLRIFFAESNRIETLDGDIFKYNLNVSQISFQHNSIIQFEHKYLNALESADFRDNKCIDNFAHESSSLTIEELKAKLLAQCSCTARCSINKEVDELGTTMSENAKKMEELVSKALSIGTLVAKQAKTIEDLTIVVDEQKVLMEKQSTSIKALEDFAKNLKSCLTSTLKF